MAADLGEYLGEADDLYGDLRLTLNLALRQAAEGKGKTRHAQVGQAWLDQPIMSIARTLPGLTGMGFHAGQAVKKAGEAIGMVERGELEAASAEILGAIVYLAAMHVQVLERKGQRPKDWQRPKDAASPRIGTEERPKDAASLQTGPLVFGSSPKDAASPRTGTEDKWSGRNLPPGWGGPPNPPGLNLHQDWAGPPGPQGRRASNE